MTTASPIAATKTDGRSAIATAVERLIRATVALPDEAMDRAVSSPAGGEILTN